MEEKEKLKMLKNAKFTIGKVGKWHYKTTWKTAGSDYTYVLGGNNFEGVFPYNNLKNHVGKSYLVIFDSTNYSKSELIYDYPIPDGIKAPTNGWRYKEVPFSIDSSKIRKYLLKE